MSSVCPCLVLSSQPAPDVNVPQCLSAVAWWSTERLRWMRVKHRGGTVTLGKAWVREDKAEWDDKVWLCLEHHGVQKQVHTLYMQLHCSIVFKRTWGETMNSSFPFLAEQRVAAAVRDEHFHDGTASLAESVCGYVWLFFGVICFTKQRFQTCRHVCFQGLNTIEILEYTQVAPLVPLLVFFKDTKAFEY